MTPKSVTVCADRVPKNKKMNSRNGSGNAKRKSDQSLRRLCINIAAVARNQKTGGDMPFKKFDTNKYPPRQWAIVSYPGDGKSSFATQMIGPILTIDADHRFGEVAAMAKDGAYQLSEEAADNNNPDTVAKILERDMPNSGIKTIVVDSLTAIIQPMVMKAFRGNLAGENKNKSAAYADKATAMRTLQHAVSRWGVDTLWIWHLQDGRDNKGKESVTQTLTTTERKRIFSSLNMVLHIECDGVKRGIKVVWARNGHQYPELPILWDDSGMWDGMPEKIEAAVYANGVAPEADDYLAEGLTERKAFIDAAPSDPFPSVDDAIYWAVEVSKAYKTKHAAQIDYDEIKAAKQPSSAKAMRDLWVEAVADAKFGTEFPRDASGEPVAA